MVTAEIAVALPGLCLLLGVALAAVGAAAAQVACVDAARTGARAAARGDDAGAVRRLVAGIAPPGADVEVADDGAFARVTVRVTVPLVPGAPVSVPVRGTAATPVEPTGAAAL
ncbi:TadE family type IV pilus minor pilin [Marinactinospora rubrisoli]|uniref:TadE family type IV pilus minor pilin n=1 Tax=Marinactinospora rubrisoli TaxID=2715399 RepID=A0ABW2K8C2_9ACTN